MSELRRQVARLASLSARYDLAEAGREGKVLSEVIQVLREMALELDEVVQNQREIEDYVEDIDNDLLFLEEAVSDTDDEDEEWEPDVDLDTLEDASGDGETYIELECPACDQPSYFAEHLFAEDPVELSCPHCGYVVFDSSADELVSDDEDAVDDRRSTFAH
ncbi:MAG: CD1247 N-terminal domain-containing protein [Clostridia bacterium]